MNKTQRPTMDDQDPNITPEVKTEEAVAFEPASETFEVGDSTVTFVEPTEEERPSDTVPPESEGKIGTGFWSPEGDDWKFTKIGQTKDGNAVLVVKRKEGTGYEVQFGHGMKAKEFQGWFTTYDKAEQAARTYLNKHWEHMEA